MKRDLSDLVDNVRWARDNDAEARKIVLAGQEYARNNLLPQNVLCYHIVLLKVSFVQVKRKQKKLLAYVILSIVIVGFSVCCYTAESVALPYNHCNKPPLSSSHSFTFLHYLSFFFFLEGVKPPFTLHCPSTWAQSL